MSTKFRPGALYARRRNARAREKTPPGHRTGHLKHTSGQSRGTGQRHLYTGTPTGDRRVAMAILKHAESWSLILGGLGYLGFRLAQARIRKGRP